MNPWINRTYSLDGFLTIGLAIVRPSRPIAPVLSKVAKSEDWKNQLAPHTWEPDRSYCSVVQPERWKVQRRVKWPCQIVCCYLRWFEACSRPKVSVIRFVPECEFRGFLVVCQSPIQFKMIIVVVDMASESPWERPSLGAYCSLRQLTYRRLQISILSE